MAELPKRRWFQIHLSTAIVMMFAAGLALWLNVRVPYSDQGNPFVASFGWPRCCYRQYTNNEVFEKELAIITDYAKVRSAAGITNPIVLPEKHQWYFDGVVCNIAVTATLLLAGAFVCEYFIRRREVGV